MKVSLEHIIELVTREVIRELRARGYEVEETSREVKTAPKTNPVLEPDMSAFRTPLLTEHHLTGICSKVKEIRVPAKTIITPGAKDLIRKKNLTISYKS